MNPVVWKATRYRAVVNGITVQVEFRDWSQAWEVQIFRGGECLEIEPYNTPEEAMREGLKMAADYRPYLEQFQKDAVA